MLIEYWEAHDWLEYNIDEDITQGGASEEEIIMYDIMSQH